MSSSREGGFKCLPACTPVTDALRSLSTLLNPRLMNHHILDMDMSSKCLSNRGFGYSSREINSDSTLRAKTQVLAGLSFKIKNTKLVPTVSYLQTGSGFVCRHCKASVSPQSVEHTLAKGAQRARQSCPSLTPLENADLNLKRKWHPPKKLHRSTKTHSTYCWGAAVPNATVFTKGEGVQWGPDKQSQAAGLRPGSMMKANITAHEHSTTFRG